MKPISLPRRAGTRDVLCIAILVLAVAATFLPVKDFSFTNWDDPEYLLFNEHAQSLTWENVKWAFTHLYAGNYHPLTWISHMVDASLYGLDSRGHHSASLVFHIMNVLLVFLVASRLTGKSWYGFWLAMLFGLHPMNVESVAWISERKNLLSTLFALLAIDSYREYCQDLRVSKYLLAAAFLLASLLSKPMMVTLPVLLLILDWRPLRRFSKRAVLEKIPLLGLAALCGLATMAAQRQAHAVALLGRLPLLDRLAHACFSYWSYAGKILWPVELSPYYPLPGLETSGYQPWIPWLAGAALIFVSWAIRRVAQKAPMVAAGGLWFMVSLLPVIGIIQVGAQGMADRYAYVPMLGLLSCLMGIIDLLYRKIPAAEPASETGPTTYVRSGATGKLHFLLLNGGLACLATVWAIGTARQLPIWKDSLSLWQHALPRCPTCYVVRFNLADAWIRAGRPRAALPHLEAAARIRPWSDEPYARLGETYSLLGDLPTAERAYATAIERAPSSAGLRLGHGRVLYRMRKWEEALADFRAASEKQPEDPETLADMARALARLQRKEEARELLLKALKLAPRSEELQELLKALE